MSKDCTFSRLLGLSGIKFDYGYWSFYAMGSDSAYRRASSSDTKNNYKLVITSLYKLYSVNDKNYYQKALNTLSANEINYDRLEDLSIVKTFLLKYGYFSPEHINNVYKFYESVDRLVKEGGMLDLVYYVDDVVNLRIELGASLASNLQTPIELLSKLVQSDEKEIVELAVNNPNYNVDNLIKEFINN